MIESSCSFAVSEASGEKPAEAKTSSGIKCPHCGAAILEDDEICPSCGRKLVSLCTFCGAPMDWSDSECPECGASAEGITCPSCGHLCFRSFCPECNTPVTRAAARMVEAAKQDPLFAEASRKNAEAEELGRKLEEATEAEAPQIRQELIKVTDDLNGILERMLPPAGSTPQEQRNYYSARKVAVQVKVTRRIKLGWVCNYCGSTHDNPSDCVKPFLGGKWKYEDVTTTQTEYVKK